MLIGIDVGHFYRWNPLPEGRILKTAKHPTKEDDLQDSIFAFWTNFFRE